MVKNFINKSKNILFSQQTSILSAASVIMVMVIASRLLGFVRQRVFLSFFPPDTLSLFFAAFRLPDLIFEVLTLGALSSAFIPIFTRLHKKDKKLAWETTSIIVNLGLVGFAILSISFGLLANQLYSIIAPGFDHNQTLQIAYIARILFAAQGFFVVSYALTGVLESLRRFIITALAPLFYNIGIILGTILLAPKLGLMAPAVGVIIGSFAHLLVQLPLAYRLGFRFSFKLAPNLHVKKIGRLAAPRMMELAFLQVARTIELFLSSIIASASYTYFTLANSLQAFPVGLFGVSLAKAALPTLTEQSDNPQKFKHTLLSTLYLVIFLIVPVAVFLTVLRIPIVRILFGTNLFDWEATVQTGLVISAFALGVPFQATVILLSRAYYALHDTKTPVIISFMGTIIGITSSVILIRVLGVPTWGLSLSYSIGVSVQAIVLFCLLSKKLNGGIFFTIKPILKTITASAASGSIMFFILKFFDRSVWVKKLSFLTNLETTKNLNFESFVLDTRYTANLITLTVVTAAVGGITYLVVSFLLKSTELQTIIKALTSRRFKTPKSEGEPISPTTTDTIQV